MRAKGKVETLFVFPLALLFIVLGVHVQHNPTGKVARALEWFFERRHHD